MWRICWAHNNASKRQMGFNLAFKGLTAYSIRGLFLIFIWRNSPQRAMASSSTRFLDHTQTQHSRWDSSGQVISPSQRPLPDNTQHSQQTSTPPLGFEPTISAGERPQTHVLHRAVTGTDKNMKYRTPNFSALSEIHFTKSSEQNSVYKKSHAVYEATKPSQK